MKTNSINKEKLTMGILAHVDAGKTTLSEAIMYKNGNIRKLGRVDHGDAFLDNNAIERERGITIYSKQAVFDLDKKHVTLLDTPGHVDFSPEMERTLKVLDVAVLVISAQDKVQSHTETLWKLLESYDIPVVIFINKMDQPGADINDVMKDIRERLSESCVLFSAKGEIGELYEEIAMCDEKALEEYLSEDKVSNACISEIIAQRKLFPCYHGSALKLYGIDELLTGIDTFVQPKGYLESFGAKVIKITRDVSGKRLTHMKLTGGSLKVKDEILPGEKADQIRVYSGSRYDILEEAFPGDVIALTGPTSTYAGQGVGAEKDYCAGSMTPVITRTMIPPEGTDVSKLMDIIKQLKEEEPELNAGFDAHHENVQVSLMGDVQTQILAAMINERYGLDVQFGPERVIYKETIENTVVGIGHYEPLRHYAEVWLRLEPGSRGSGIVCESELTVDELDLNWQRLIMTHILEKEHLGVLCGVPLTDVKITLIAGKAHLKHTEGGDFRQATYRAIRQGLMNAKSRLLEPWYDFILDVPVENMGRAMMDIRHMGGECEPDALEIQKALLKGKAPASGIKDYQKEVLSYTAGRGRLSLSYRGYEPCHNQEEVVETMAYQPEADMDNPCGSIFCHHGSGFYIKWQDVPDYAHLSVTEHDREDTDISFVEPVQQKQLKSAAESVKGNTAGSYGIEKDLIEIYNREFGSSRQEADRYQSYRADSVSYHDEIDKKRIIKSEKHYKRIKKKTGTYLLVDGYNIIFAWDELKELAKEDLNAARVRLMDILSNYQGYVGCKLILVFDAYKLKGHDREIYKYNNIYIVYTNEAETADQYIEKTTHELGKENDILVATSDSLEQIIVMGQGADRISADDFYEEVERVNEEIRRVERERRNKRGNYLFDHTDEETAQKIENVRLGKESFDQP